MPPSSIRGTTRDLQAPGIDLPVDDAGHRAVLRAYPILFVDDEAPNLDVFEATFGDSFHIHLEDSAAAALALLEREPVAIIISDNRMPDRLGIDLLVEVHERFPQVHRVLCTAYSDQQTAIDAINRAAVEHYLLKPWRIAEVDRLLSALVARSHLDRTARELRATLVQRERQAAVAALRHRIEHDLGNITSVLHGVSHSMREALASRSGLPAAELTELYSDLDAAVRRLTDLQRASREAGRPAPLNPTDVECAELFATVAKLASEDLQGLGCVLADPQPNPLICVDRLGLIKVLLRTISWMARADDAYSTIQLRAEASATELVHLSLAASPPISSRRMATDLEGELSLSGGPGDDLAVARELAVAIGAQLKVERTMTGGALVITLPSSDRPSR